MHAMHAYIAKIWDFLIKVHVLKHPHACNTPSIALHRVLFKTFLCYKSKKTKSNIQAINT